MTRKRWHRWVALVLPAVVWLAAPAMAAADVDPGWRLRVSVASIDFDSGLTSRSDYGIDVGAALAINGEYRFNRRLGLDLGAFGGGGVDVTGRRSWIGWSEHNVYDTVSLSGLTAGLDVHLTPDSRVDLYICPMVAIMEFGSLAFETGPSGLRSGIDFDADLAVGASLGLGVPFGDRSSWSFNAQLTHLESTLNGGDHTGLRIDQDYNATMFGVGFGYRF
jgi:opacity protein-like surface antigen